MTTLLIAVAVVLVLLAIAVYPRKQTNGAQAGSPPPSWDTSGLRVRQVNEEAHAIAEEFRQRAEDAWRADLREKASKLLTDSK
ncbi:hypothetical protein SH449x_002724 [Pirellulaceae bacterium SH449]